jgi:hypothetical protein
VVIGAGIAGLYQLHKLREMGLKVKAYETGSGVGGTWYWNRYPGSRFDSQVEDYQYWFSEELYKAWKPSERFPGQPENEAWLNFVADWLDLKKDIQFNSRVASAHYNEDTQRWLVTTDAGERIDTQYVIACLGMLSAPLAGTTAGQLQGQIHHAGLAKRDWTGGVVVGRHNRHQVIRPFVKSPMTIFVRRRNTSFDATKYTADTRRWRRLPGSRNGGGTLPASLRLDEGPGRQDTGTARRCCACCGTTVRSRLVGLVPEMFRRVGQF